MSREIPRRDKQGKRQYVTVNECESCKFFDFEEKGEKARCRGRFGFKVTPNDTCQDWEEASEWE